MEILDFLPEIEKLTWDEILKNRRDGGHHQVDVRRICSAAQKRLKERDIDVEWVWLFFVERFFAYS